MMAADGADNEPDQVPDAFLEAVRPEHRADLRALVQTAQEPPPNNAASDRRADRTPDDDSGAGEGSPRSPRSTREPFPALNPAQSARVTNALIVAAERLAGVPIAHSLIQSPDAPSRTTELPGTTGMTGRQSLGNAVRLSDVTPERIRWLWPGRVPAGKITVLDGDPGLGKSTLLCEVAARITRGDPLPGGEPAAPRGVLLLSAEDDLSTPSALASMPPAAIPTASAPSSPFRIAPKPDGPSPSLATSPFSMPSLNGSMLPSSSSTRSSPICAPASAPIGTRMSAGPWPPSRPRLERTGAAIVVVRHLNKSAQTNPLYRGLGSIGIIGAARCALLLAADPDDADRRILAVSKGNLARPPAALAFRLDDVPGTDVARIVWEGESPWTAGELLGRLPAEEGDESRSAVDDARAWLREALAAGPRPASELRRESAARGIGLSTLYAARKAEGIATAKEHIARGRWLWMLQDNSGGREDAVPSGS